MKTLSSRSGLVLAPVLCALLLLDAENTHAQLASLGSWTAAGSTGIVDEADVSEVVFDTAGVALRLTAPAQARAVLRYPITFAPAGSYSLIFDGEQIIYSFRSSPTVRLALTYERPDEWAYAAATLKRVRLADGITSVLGSVNAWDLPLAPGTQTVEKTIACAPACFFPGGEFAYYIEVILWKPYAPSNPRVVAVRLMPG